MLMTPPLTRKSPPLGRFFHAEHLYNGALFCPFESGLSMADSQAGGRVVPAQVAEAPAASPSCCFPPGVLLRGRWTGRDAAFTMWTKQRETRPQEGASSRLRAGRDRESIGDGVIPHSPVSLTGLLENPALNHLIPTARVASA